MEELQSADISVINNEFVFSDGGDEQTNKAYTFRAKTANVSMLDVFGADLANLANNHVYDYRASGLMDTIATLNNYGIVTMGAGANLAEAECAISRKDFLSKVYIALKECAETKYWLDILWETEYLSQQQYQSISGDCEEIRKMLSSTTKTVSSTLNSQNSTL